MHCSLGQGSFNKKPCDSEYLEYLEKVVSQAPASRVAAGEWWGRAGPQLIHLARYKRPNNKNIIDVIDPFPDIFDIFYTLLIFIFFELLIIFDHHDHHGSWMIWMTWMT